MVNQTVKSNGLVRPVKSLLESEAGKEFLQEVREIVAIMEREL